MSFWCNTPSHHMRRGRYPCGIGRNSLLYYPGGLVQRHLPADCLSGYDRVNVSAVICSEIKPIRKTITDALIINMLILVNRPIVKYVYA